jgi:hypothetical protein
LARDDDVCASLRYIAVEKVPNLRHTTEVIGAYVTEGTRIHHYKYLDKLKQMALYCDSESVIFIQPDDQPALIETGDCLGAMTPGLHIEEFVSGGPKNYAYRTVNPTTGVRETVCKVRGITLNYSASKLVNFDAMRDMICEGTNLTELSTYRAQNQSKESGRANRYNYGN